MKLPCLVHVTVSDLTDQPYQPCLETATKQIFEQLGWSKHLSEWPLEWRAILSEPVLKPLTGINTEETLDVVVSVSDVKTNYLELRYVLFCDQHIQARAEFKARIFCYDTHAQQIDWPSGLKSEFDAAWFEQNWSDDSD